MIEAFYVRVVTAHPGKIFATSQDIRFSTKKSAIDIAEKMQEEFDEDCEPKRVYVLGADRVPLVAAGRSRMSAMKSLRKL